MDGRGDMQIWDSVRRRWLVLTPEEWVRQHLIRFLCEGCGADPMLVRQEHPAKIHGMAQRADIVVYSRNGVPLLLAECKAPAVEIGAAAFDQAARYNSVLGARYVVITNGLRHYVHELREDGRYVALAQFPDLNEL